MSLANAIIVAALTLGLNQQGSAAPPRAHFLSKEEVATAFTQGPDSKYFDRLQLAELRAKTDLPLQGLSLAAARIRARDAYVAAAGEFTPRERAAFSEALEHLQPVLQARAPLYARTPWCFIKLTRIIEGGMPYTYGDCIVLDARIVAGAAQVLTAGSAQQQAAVDNLLLHEQTHVLQRRNPALFAKFYESTLGFRHVQFAPLPEWMVLRRVINPDGPDDTWIFSVGSGVSQHWYLPEILLKNMDQPKMPSDFQIVALPVNERQGRFELADASAPVRMQNLDDIAEFQQRYPVHGEVFHPNEVAAVLLAALLTNSANDEPTHDLWGRTRDWMDKALR